MKKSSKNAIDATIRSIAAANYNNSIWGCSSGSYMDFSRPNAKCGWFWTLRTLKKSKRPLTLEMLNRLHNMQKNVHKVRLTSNVNIMNYVKAGIVRQTKVYNPFTGRKIAAYKITELGKALLKSCL